MAVREGQKCRVEVLMCIYSINWLYAESSGGLWGVFTSISSLLHQNVEPDHSPTIEAFSNPANAQKNRYGNINCCEYLCLLCKH